MDKEKSAYICDQAWFNVLEAQCVFSKHLLGGP